MHCRHSSACTKHISSVFSFYSKATLYAVRTLVDSCGTIHLDIRHYLVAPQIWRSWCCSCLHTDQKTACKSIYTLFHRFATLQTCTSVFFRETLCDFIGHLWMSEWKHEHSWSVKASEVCQTSATELHPDRFPSLCHSFLLPCILWFLIICDQPLTLCSHCFVLCLDVSSFSWQREAIDGAVAAKTVCSLWKGNTLLCYHGKS